MNTLRSSGRESREPERNVARILISSSPRLGIAENAVPGGLINETRRADARVPVVVREMMKSALRNCAAPFSIRLECNGNIELGARGLAPAASDDSSSHTTR